MGFERNVIRVYPAAVPTNKYFLPSCFAVGGALRAEHNPVGAGLKRRDDRIIRSGTFADIEVVAS